MGRRQILLELEVAGRRTASESVATAPRGVVGAETNRAEQRRCLGRSNVSLLGSSVLWIYLSYVLLLESLIASHYLPDLSMPLDDNQPVTNI